MYIEDCRVSLLCSSSIAWQANATKFHFICGGEGPGGGGGGKVKLRYRCVGLFFKRGLCGLGSFHKMLSKAKHRHKLPQP